MGSLNFSRNLGPPTANTTVQKLNVKTKEVTPTVVNQAEKSDSLLTFLKNLKLYTIIFLIIYKLLCKQVLKSEEK